MSIADFKHLVEETKAAHPSAWAAAHRGGADTEHFIRLLTARIHQVDARCGLLGQRGDPNVIADDAVLFLGEGPGHDPTRGNTPVSAFDVIAGAGGDNPQPAWQFLDLPGPAAWVAPPAVAPDPVPAPDPRPAATPVCRFQAPTPVDFQPILDTINRLSDVQSELIQSQRQLAEAIEVVRQHLDHLNQRLVIHGLQIDSGGVVGRITGTAKLPQ